MLIPQLGSWRNQSSLLGKINPQPITFFVFASGLTFTVTSSNPDLVPNENITIASDGFVRSIVISPKQDQSGSATISVTATDTQGSSTTRAFVVIVTSVNDPPTISDFANQTILEDTLKTIEFTVGDVETQAVNLTVSGSSGNTGLIPAASIVFGGSGETRTVTLTPAANQSGTTTVTVTVSDGAKTATKQFTITMNPEDDAPVLSLQGTISKPNGVYTIPFVIDDVDTPAGQLVIVVRSSNQGVLPDSNITVNKQDGVVKSYPTAQGTTALEFSVSDGPTTIEQRRELTVGVPYALRISNIQNQVIKEGEFIRLAFSVDESETGNISVVAKSSNQNLISDSAIQVVGSGRSFDISVTPAEGQIGTAEITVTASDEFGSGTKSFFVTVEPVNNPPTISVIPDQVSNQGDTSPVINFSVQDGPGETPAANLIVTATSDNPGLVPASGIVTGGSDQSRSLRITPTPNQFGVANITVTVTDTGNAGGADVKSASRTFLLTVNQVQQKPEVSVIPDMTTLVNTETDIIQFTVSDQETAAAKLTVSTISSSNPTLIPLQNVQFGGSGAARQMIIVPAPDQSGESTVRFRVTDNDDPTPNSTERTSKITVSNLFPKAIANVLNAFEALSNAEENKFVIISGNKTVAEAVLDASRSFNGQLLTYKWTPVGAPPPDDSNSMTTQTRLPIGEHTITLEVTDSAGRSGTDVIKVEVIDGETAVKMLAGRMKILASLRLEGQFATLSAAANSFGGGHWKSGIHQLEAFLNQIRLQLKDYPDVLVQLVEFAQQIVDSIKAQIANANSPPAITTFADKTIGSNSSAGPQPFQVADAETDAGLLEVTATSSNQTLVPNSNILLGGLRNDRTVTVRPVPGQIGSVVITITVKDNGSPPGTPSNAQAASTSFTLNVRAPGNTPPTISDIAGDIIAENKPTGVIPFTVDDAETAKGFLIVTAQSSDPTLIPPANIFFGGSGGARTLFITPGFNQIGTATITLTVTDGGGLTDSTSFQVTVTPVIEPPPSTAADFNGDGKPDILFQDANGFLAFWSMDGEDRDTAELLNPNNSGDPNWRVVSSGNFNPDANADLLFQHTNGDLAVWYVDGTSITSPTLVTPANPGAGWRAIGAGDFNGDGKSDILLQKDDRTLSVWYMDGVVLTSSTLLSPANPGADWAAVAVNDFNSDGNADILFQDNVGMLTAWYMNGVDLNSATLVNPASSGADWVVRSSTDLDSDGNPDLVFQNALDGRLAVWFLNGVDLIRATSLNPAVPGGTWQVVGP